jgi:hypothetical protein
MQKLNTPSGIVGIALVVIGIFVVIILRMGSINLTYNYDTNSSTAQHLNVNVGLGSTPTSTSIQPPFQQPTTQPYTSTQGNGPILQQTYKSGQAHEHFDNYSLRSDEVIVGDAVDFDNRDYKCVAYGIQGPTVISFDIYDGQAMVYNNVDNSNHKQIDELVQERFNYMKAKSCNGGYISTSVIYAHQQ